MSAFEAVTTQERFKPSAKAFRKRTGMFAFLWFSGSRASGWHRTRTPRPPSPRLRSDAGRGSLPQYNVPGPQESMIFDSQKGGVVDLISKCTRVTFVYFLDG